MPLEERQTQYTEITKDNLFYGLPTLDFEPLNPDGSYDVPRGLGLMDTAELQKVVETIQLPNREGGAEVVAREIVSKLEVSYELGLFNFVKENAAIFFGSSTITDNPAGTESITNELVDVPNDLRKFAELVGSDIDDTSWTVTNGPVVGEYVGSSDGVTGGTLGDYSLNFQTTSGDTVQIFFNGVDVTDASIGYTIVEGAPNPGEIGFTPDSGAANTDLTFGTGTIPSAGTQITASYTPGFAFVKNTDYVTDPLFGRIRFLDDSNLFKLAVGQPMHIDYSWDRKASSTLKPFTQKEFQGRGTIKNLPDVGANFIWTIPKLSIRITDDALTHASDNFATGTLVVQILDNGGTEPFGSMIWASETQHLAVVP